MNKMFWFCLLAMVAVAGCKEDPCDDFSNYYSIDERMKPYLFEEGTYWIYHNSVTGEIDSEYVYMVENRLDTPIFMKYTCGVNYAIYEGVYETHKSSKHPNDSLLWFGWGGAVSPFIGADKNGTRNALLFLSDKNTSYTGGCFSYKGFNGQLDINGNAFSSVDCFAMKSDSGCNSIFNYTTDFYFAPHFGLIKKIEYNTPNGTQEWNLIRWNIVQ